jgi:hypothetical protein
VPRFADIFDAHTIDHQWKTDQQNHKAEAAGWIVLHPVESVCLDGGWSIVISGVPWSKPYFDVLDELASRDSGTPLLPVAHASACRVATLGDAR